VHVTRWTWSLLLHEAPTCNTPAEWRHRILLPALYPLRPIRNRTQHRSPETVVDVTCSDVTQWRHKVHFTVAADVIKTGNCCDFAKYRVRSVDGRYKPVVNKYPLQPATTELMLRSTPIKMADAATSCVHVYCKDTQVEYHGLRSLSSFTIPFHPKHIFWILTLCKFCTSLQDGIRSWI
jgi:hypothetical protein